MLYYAVQLERSDYMAKRQTTETFKARVSELTDGAYSVVGEYVNNKTKILITHKVCGVTYLVRPKSFLDGNRCPACRNKLRGASKKTQADFEKEIANLTNNEYYVIGAYSGATEKVEIAHTICGNSWKVTPNRFLSCGTRCPTCMRKATGKAQRLTTAQFIQKLNERFPEEYTVLSNYTGSLNKVYVRHNKCGNEWWIKANHLLSHNMCPRCKESKGETLVRAFLVSRELPFEEQKTFPNLKRIKHLSYDFYVPRLKLLVEYQGKQHYEAIDYFGGQERFIEQKISDNIKRKYAKEHGFRLVEIPYTVNNIETVTAYLEDKLNM